MKGLHVATHLRTRGHDATVSPTCHRLPTTRGHLDAMIHMSEVGPT